MTLVILPMKVKVKEMQSVTWDAGNAEILTEQAFPEAEQGCKCITETFPEYSLPYFTFDRFYSYIS